MHVKYLCLCCLHMPQLCEWNSLILHKSLTGYNTFKSDTVDCSGLFKAWSLGLPPDETIGERERGCVRVAKNYTVSFCVWVCFGGACVHVCVEEKKGRKEKTVTEIVEEKVYKINTDVTVEFFLQWLMYVLLMMRTERRLFLMTEQMMDTVVKTWWESGWLSEVFLISFFPNYAAH